MVASALEVGVEEVVAGVVYPNLQSLTDGIFTQLYPEDIQTGIDAKYEGLAPVIKDMDMSWLLKNYPDTPTDPRERTHLYLQQVEATASRMLDQDGSAYFDRHFLHQIFPGHEFIGTPLAYDDIGIGIAPDDPGSVVLKALGGGYGVRRLPDNPKSDTIYPIFSGIRAELQVPIEYEGDSIALPVQEICRNVARAAFQLGIMSEQDAQAELEELHTPRIRRQYDFPTHTTVKTYTSPATETSVHVAQQFQTVLTAKVGSGLMAVTNQPKGVKTIVDGQDRFTKEYTTHPRHGANNDEVAYGLDPEERGDRRISIALSLPPDRAPNKENNERIALAKASLLNPI